MGSALDALVEIARGIHPAILSQCGLAAALRALARRSPVPVELHETIEGPLPDDVEERPTRRLGGAHERRQVRRRLDRPRRRHD
jgi:hypothetical protein